jgi:hypothetical protein
MDEFIAHIKLFRDLVGNLAIAQGKYPQLALDQALKKLVEDELKAVVENQSVDGRIEVSFIEMPTFLGEKTVEEVQSLENQVLTDFEFFSNILISDIAIGPNLRKEAFEKYTSLLLIHRDLVNRLKSKVQLKISGNKNITITKMQYDEIQELLKNNHKIDAIKKLCEISNLGIKDAKDAIESRDFSK